MPTPNQRILLPARALVLLGIGDPALIVGILALVGVLHLTPPVPLVLTLVGVFLNGMAVAEIVRGAGARRPNG